MHYENKTFNNTFPERVYQRGKLDSHAYGDFSLLTSDACEKSSQLL